MRPKDSANRKIFKKLTRGIFLAGFFVEIHLGIEKMVTA
jgi:hypothetical protein